MTNPAEPSYISKAARAALQYAKACGYNKVGSPMENQTWDEISAERQVQYLHHFVKIMLSKERQLTNVQM